MSRTVTLGEIDRQARELADQEESQGTLVDTAEIRGMINGSLAQWHGMIALAVPERFEERQSVDAATSLSTADDYFATLDVENDEGVPLERLQFHERHKYGRTTSTEAYGYRVVKDALVLYPPVSSGTYTHIYVSASPVLTQDSDTVDGYNGWEQWVVYDVAMKLLVKENGDIRDLMTKQQLIEQDMMNVATEREMANPSKVVDTRLRASTYLRNPDFWAGR